MGLPPTNVLIVDDEPHVCDLIRDGLEDKGFYCITASNPPQAKEILNCQRFDVVIADIVMPGVSGLDLLAHTKKVAPDSKVILITGASNIQFLARALAMGAYDYFQKPFDLDKLAKATSRAAEGEPLSSPLAIRAARAMQSEPYLRQASLESIRALVRAVEAKDPYTRRHSEQVTHYALNLAGHFNLSPDQMATIRVASLLHDIGKIGIPDEILTKAGALSEEEFEHVRLHPRLGAEILQNISVFAEEARLVRYHHENWDGSGYPDGLAGEEIPFGSRIINVADSIDAMLMQRTYKNAYPIEKVVSELQRCAGAQFESTIALAAAKWCQSHPEKLILSANAA
ncbi:MAG: response regulator [Phycisphaerae bacterium]|nr:response regulator [Phycisphaerae bacterium]